MTFYNLELAAAPQPMQALELLAEHQEFEWETTRLSRPLDAGKRLVGEHLIITASVVDQDSYQQRWLQENFGFRSSLFMHMEVFSPSEEALHAAVRAVMRCSIVLLKRFDGDAILTEYNEALILHRLKNRLMLNASAFRISYNRQAISEISLPYEMQELPYRV